MEEVNMLDYLRYFWVVEAQQGEILTRSESRERRRAGEAWFAATAETAMTTVAFPPTTVPDWDSILDGFLCR